MEKAKETILTCVLRHADDEVGLVSALQLLLQELGKEGYTTIFNVLGDVDIPPDSAEEEWHKVIVHWENLCGILGRKVKVMTALCDYLGSVNKQLTTPKLIELKRFQKVLTRSKFDPLTGLLNRHDFEYNLNHEIARSTRHGNELSLLFFDIDDFKSINDTYGHSAGDMVLQNIAALIEKEKRAEDVVTRFGGDEIALILPESSTSDTFVLAERIRHRIEEFLFSYGKDTIPVTVSGGLASWSVKGMKRQDLINKADMALYQAKREGKNRVVPFVQNKRKHVRVPFDSSVDIHGGQSKNDRAIEGQGRNISASGILVEIPLRFDSEEQVYLSLGIQQCMPCLLNGTVVRVEEMAAKKFGIGVSFLEMEKETSGALHHYISEKLKDESDTLLVHLTGSA